MIKILRLIFKEYDEDPMAKYIHCGIGYTGLDNDTWSINARSHHHGVGYTGVYDE